MKILSFKKILNFIDNNYKESENIVKVVPLVYAIGVLSFWFGQKLISWGFLLIVIGGLFNWFVISANKGNMPVLIESRKQFSKLLKRNPNRKVCMVTKKTKFSWLADRFYLWKSSLSLGDFVATMGLVLFVMNLIITINKIS